MSSEYRKRGARELRAMRRQSRALYWCVAVFSLFANLLMLTGPIYMLQVYDRVLSAGSFETLVALSLIAVFLYAVMGVLDGARGRIVSRIAARFQDAAEERVFNAQHARKLRPQAGVRQGSISDLDAVVRCIGSPVLPAIYDAPWTPVLFIAIFILHPTLGALGLAGAIALILITLANQLLSHQQQASADHAASDAERIATRAQAEAEVIQALAMRDAVYARWKAARTTALCSQRQVANVSGSFGALTRTLRLMLQSAMLGVGAALVMSGQMTGGGMIAGSILLGRALGPIETLLVHWALVQRAHHGWSALSDLLGQSPHQPEPVNLPKPGGTLRATNVSVAPPGDTRLGLRGLNFVVEPGEAMGVIGPSGSGKSSLARVLTGIWPVTAGALRLDGAAVSHYGAETLGRYVGYLPQRVQVFEGTVAENIARLAEPVNETKVIAASKLAAAHHSILALPRGYDTVLQADAAPLCGGQLQRIGLARALYHDPVLVVLDEPNAHLDNAGSIALNEAIRALKRRGAAVLIMAHRPAAIQECDLLLVLDGGSQTAFGPKEQVLASMVKNAEAIRTVSDPAKGAA